MLEIQSLWLCRGLLLPIWILLLLLLLLKSNQTAWFGDLSLGRGWNIFPSACSSGWDLAELAWVGKAQKCLYLSASTMCLKCFRWGCSVTQSLALALRRLRRAGSCLWQRYHWSTAAQWNVEPRGLRAESSVSAAEVWSLSRYLSPELLPTLHHATGFLCELRAISVAHL